MLSAELLSLGVKAHSSLNQLVHFEVLKVQLNWRLLVTGALQTWEEQLNMPDELFNEFLIERVLEKGLLCP